LRRSLVAAGISLPVIFITADDTSATRVATLESGCVAYLTKPFSATALMGAIETASASRASIASVAEKPDAAQAARQREGASGWPAGRAIG
jgi:DNA-binding response OmpR family regulator